MAAAPRVLGIAELAMRWSVSRQRADQVTRADESENPFPEGTQLAATRVYEIDDIEAWEKREQEAGRPLPGQARRGPGIGHGGRPRSRPDA